MQARLDAVKQSHWLSPLACFVQGYRYQLGDALFLHHHAIEGVAALHGCLLYTSRAALHNLREADKAIEDEAVSARLKRMTDAGGKIFDILEKEPSRASEVRRFMNYYLPTADKLLTQYRELDGSGSQGVNVRGAMTVVENSLEMIAVAFERQLDSLYRHEAMDIQTDIDVLETMLAADGIRPERKPEETASEKKEEEPAHV